MRTLILVVLAAFCAPLAIAQTADQKFQQGNALYQQGRYAEAVVAYEEIIRAGYTSGALAFNLGNAYYKQGLMGKAILNYERAIRFMPGDDDVRHNLYLANLQIVDKIEPAPRLFLWDLWDDIKEAFSLDGITWITYLFFLLVSAALTLIILARSYAARKAGLLSAMLCGLLLLLSVSILVGKATDVNRADDAVITVAIVTAKNSPDQKSSDAFVLHAGVKVRITESIGEWVRIRLADGKVGWVELGVAERI
jgi:tetratricopeptide (TPR) repeat protein